MDAAGVSFSGTSAWGSGEPQVPSFLYNTPSTLSGTSRSRYIAPSASYIISLELRCRPAPQRPPFFGAALAPSNATASVARPNGIPFRETQLLPILQQLRLRQHGKEMTKITFPVNSIRTSCFILQDSDFKFKAISGGC